jgi:hypothetical protein
MNIVPCIKFYICSRQIQQDPLKYRVIVNSGLRNFFNKMEGIIRRLDGSLEIENGFSTICFFFWYNRTYMCSRYMWTLWLHLWDTRIFCRYVTRSNSMGSLGNSSIFRYSFMHACVCHLMKKTFRQECCLTCSLCVKVYELSWWCD